MTFWPNLVSNGSIWWVLVVVLILLPLGSAVGGILRRRDFGSEPSRHNRIRRQAHRRFRAVSHLAFNASLDRAAALRHLKLASWNCHVMVTCAGYSKLDQYRQASVARSAVATIAGRRRAEAFFAPYQRLLNRQGGAEDALMEELSDDLLVLALMLEWRLTADEDLSAG